LEAAQGKQRVRVWPRRAFLGACASLLALGAASLALCWDSAVDRLGRAPLPGSPAKVPATSTFEASPGDRVLAEARRLLESGDARAAVSVLASLSSDDPAYPLALRLRAQAEAVARQR
jgi:hypothetical protein